MRKACLFAIMLVLGIPVPVWPDTSPLSRVHVTAVSCLRGSKRDFIDRVVPPSVTLYDQNENERNTEKAPRVTVTEATKTEIHFYFDAAPGFYEALLAFPDLSRSIGHNGPLIVLPGRDRHLMVSTCQSLADWHARGVVTGLLPAIPVTVSVLVFSKPMRCDDDFRALNQATDQPMFPFRVWDAVIDDGAYYANFYGYGKQDHSVALLLSGALFEEGAILLTDTPNTSSDARPYIRKDLTSAIIGAAFSNGDELACVNGF